jgi:hypothetical protein
MRVREAAAGAAGQMRAWLREEGQGTCCRCLVRRMLDDIVVVYGVPLASGGADAPSNVKVMCKRCAAAAGR